MRLDRWKLYAPIAAGSVVVMMLALHPVAADPLAGTAEYPDVVFLARNDVPFDAQTAASVAAQLGAPIFITPPTVLSPAAAGGIADANPDIIFVAGGTVAISGEVAEAAAAQCSPTCTIERFAGADRDETAVALATIAGEYGFAGPALVGGGQVVGDLNVGGAIHGDSLGVQRDELVTNLNADLLDGIDSSDLVQHADLLWALVDGDTGAATLIRSRGATAAGSVGTGRYTVTFDRDITNCGITATLADATGSAGPPGEISLDQPVGSMVEVNTYRSDGVPVDLFNTDGFHLRVIC